MKHLKNYKIFENQSETHGVDYSEILYDFLDKYDFKRFDGRTHRVMFSSQKLRLKFEISDSYHFGAKCVKIRFTDTGKNIKKGVHKDFKGILDQDMVNDLMECHNKLIDFINPVHVEVGSLGVYTKDFDMVYFKETPNFERCGDVEIYGSNVAIRLDKLNHWLLSNSRHDNGFDVFDDNWQIITMSHLKGYSGSLDWFSYGPGAIMDKEDNNQIVDWINGEWDKICKKLNIKTYQKIRTREKITVPEFMTHLKNNQ